MNQHHGHEDRGKDKINMADYSIFFLNIVANSGLLPAQEAMLKGTGVCGFFSCGGYLLVCGNPMLVAARCVVMFVCSENLCSQTVQGGLVCYVGLCSKLS